MKMYARTKPMTKATARKKRRKMLRLMLNHLLRLMLNHLILNKSHNPKLSNNNSQRVQR